MPDRLTAAQRAKCMRRIRSKDTSIEKCLRRALYHAGYRYRKNYAALPGTPDIAITRYRIAIFCDGEFFHGRGWLSGVQKRIEEGSNPDFWRNKIEANMRRDRETDRKLADMGWSVLRFWGRDIKRNPEACILAVEECILEREIVAYDVFVLEEALMPDHNDEDEGDEGGTPP